jgi:hypothetical protein
MSISWIKESAIGELNKLSADIDGLKHQPRHSATHTEWLFKTLSLLEEVFGRDSKYYKTVVTLPWGQVGSFMVGGPDDPEGSINPQAAVDKMHQRAYVAQLDTAKGILQAAQYQLNRVDDITVLYEGKNTPPESSLIVQIINLAERKLRKVIRDVPVREKQIQEAFENLLVGADVVYSRETDSIEYSTKTYTPDFTIIKIELAIEIKLCQKVNREKEIIAEINDDILAYQTKYGNLLFVVYDTGFIRDIDTFAATFEKNQNVVVRIVKH